MSLLFWQQLLTVDPYGRKFPDLVERLEASASFDGSAFLLSHPALTSQDRLALGKIKREALRKADGVSLLRACDLGLDWRSFGCPPFLMMVGDPGPLDAPRVAIVGTRMASTYGKATAMKFAEWLADAGVTVVSGGAFGIDAASHQGALDKGGWTWMVGGTGVTDVHPASQKPLLDRIASRGVRLSQFPVGFPSLPYNFVTRNHTIAALSEAVIVVEAPEKSGALHTARAAVEMGRDVFVVPGTISSNGFRGSHALIRDGATLVDHPDQVLEALSIRSGVAKVEEETREGPEGEVLRLLAEGPQSLEAIAASLPLSPPDLLALLSMMEIEGTIRPVPEGYLKI